jgi:hypothetical protein
MMCVTSISQLKKQAWLLHTFSSIYQLDANDKALGDSEAIESLHGRMPYASQDYFPWTVT